MSTQMSQKRKKYSENSDNLLKKFKTDSDDEEIPIVLPVNKHTLYANGIDDPKLNPKSKALLENVNPYIYAKDNTISLKVTFEQAFLLYEQEYDEDTQEAKFLLNGRVFSSATGEKYPAVGAARQKFSNTLMYYCWSLKRVHPFCPKESDDRIKKTIKNKPMPKQTYAQNEIAEDNIGFKMLKSLGWTGGGLGVDSKGIIEPVSIAMKKGKEGIGSTKPVDTKRVSIEDIKRIIDTFALTGPDVNYDLVFSPQFTKKDLQVLEHYAISLKLSPLFFGSSKFVLVISKKLTLQQIIYKILQRDPYLTHKYQIIPPYMYRDKSLDQLNRLCFEKYANVEFRKPKIPNLPANSDGKNSKQLLGKSKKERERDERSAKHNPLRDGFEYTVQSKKDMKREKATSARMKQKDYTKRFETPIQSCQSLFMEELAKYAPEKSTKKNKKKFIKRK